MQECFKTWNVICSMYSSAFSQVNVEKVTYSRLMTQKFKIGNSTQISNLFLQHLRSNRRIYRWTEPKNALITLPMHCVSISVSFSQLLRSKGSKGNFTRFMYENYENLSLETSLTTADKNNQLKSWDLLNSYCW